jgi:hypothetical protein
MFDDPGAEREVLAALPGVIPGAGDVGGSLVDPVDQVGADLDQPFSLRRLGPEE